MSALEKGLNTEILAESIEQTIYAAAANGKASAASALRLKAAGSKRAK